MSIRYLSLCSGIEAASVAWQPLGWKPVAFAEIESFPCAVLAYHYPEVPNLGDMTQIDGHQFRGKVDVLVAGTPCQAFSVAGARRGLEDERGNLTLKLVEIANAICPSFLSMHDNAFGCFLGALAGSDFPAEPGPKPSMGKSNKYWRWNRGCERHIPTWPAAGVTTGPERAVAWRTLDAQYFGLAQRRRRVFVVACPRGGSSPEQILFEWEGLRRDTPPSRQTPEDIAGTLEASLGRSRGAGTDPGACVDVCQSLTGSFGSGGPDDNKAQAGFYAVVSPQVAGTMKSNGGKTGRWKNNVEMAAAGYMPPCSQYGDVAASLTAAGADASPCADRGPTVLAVRTAQTSSNGNGIAQEVSHTLDRTNGQAVIAFHGSQYPDVSGEIAHPCGRNHGAETCICYAPEIVRQAMSSKWEKGTSGPAGDEHHNLVGCMAFAQNSRNEVRLQGGDGQISGALAADDGMKQRTYVAIPRNSGDAFSTSGNGTWREGIGPLRARGQDSHENLCLAFTERGRAEGRTLEYLEEQAYCLMNPGSGGRTHSRQIMTPQLQVRRLTPHECERLQGFPDDYTAVPYRIRNRFVSGGILPKRIVLRSYRRYLRRMARQCKEPLSFADTLKCADGPRYKAIGNSMAVNVMRWIGERVEKAVRAKELPHA